MSSSSTSMSASSPTSVSIALTVAGDRARSIGTNLRRLLRRHLVHLAGLEIVALALDLVEVGAGDAHEAGIVRIVDRVDGAVLVDAGHAGLGPVFLDRLELGVH